MSKHIATLLVTAMVVLGAALSASAADVPILEPTLPEFNNIPIPLHYENMLTRELGAGRALNLDAYVGVYGTYEDNIFQSANDKKSDYIITGLLGFIANYNSNDDVKFSFPGQIAYQYYTDHDGLNDFEAFLQPKLEVKMNDMLTFLANAGYYRNYDTVGPTDPQDTEQRFLKNEYAVGAGVNISPSDLFVVGLGADYFARRWADDLKSPLDYDEMSAYVQPMYTLSPFTKVGVKAVFGKIDRTESGYPDADYVELLAVLNWAYLNTASIRLEAGWANRDYDQDAQFATDDSDYNDPVVRLMGSYYLGDGWTLSGTYQHVPQQPDSIGYNYQTTDAFNVKLLWIPRERFRVSFSPYIQRTDPSVGDYYTEYGGGIGASYSFTELLSVGAAYNIQHRTFEAPGLDDWTDNRFTLGLNLTL